MATRDSDSGEFLDMYPGAFRGARVVYTKGATPLCNRFRSFLSSPTTTNTAAAAKLRMTVREASGGRDGGWARNRGAAQSLRRVHPQPEQPGGCCQSSGQIQGVFPAEVRGQPGCERRRDKTPAPSLSGLRCSYAKPSLMHRQGACHKKGFLFNGLEVVPRKIA